MGLELGRVLVQLWRLRWRWGVCVSRRAARNLVTPWRRLMRVVRRLLGAVVFNRRKWGLRRLGEEGRKVRRFRDVAVLVPRHAW